MQSTTRSSHCHICCRRCTCHWTAGLNRRGVCQRHGKIHNWHNLLWKHRDPFAISTWYRSSSIVKLKYALTKLYDLPSYTITITNCCSARPTSNSIVYSVGQQNSFHVMQKEKYHPVFHTNHSSNFVNHSDGLCNHSDNAWNHQWSLFQADVNLCIEVCTRKDATFRKNPHLAIRNQWRINSTADKAQSLPLLHQLLSKWLKHLWHLQLQFWHHEHHASSVWFCADCRSSKQVSLLHLTLNQKWYDNLTSLHEHQGCCTSDMNIQLACDKTYHQKRMIQLLDWMSESKTNQNNKQHPYTHTQPESDSWLEVAKSRSLICRKMNRLSNWRPPTQCLSTKT